MSEGAQAQARPKIWRTVREARRAAGRKNTPNPQPTPQDQADRGDTLNRSDGQPQGRDGAGGRGAATRSPDDACPGDLSQPDTVSTRHLRTVGPIIPHLSGCVVQVFGTFQRPMPSTVPLQGAGFLFLVASALPYVVAFLLYCRSIPARRHARPKLRVQVVLQGGHGGCPLVEHRPGLIALEA